jgi:superfamily II DNA/RNA helicase
VPDEMVVIANKFMRDPVKITIEKERLTLACIEQYFVALQNDDAKFDMLKNIFGHLTVNQCIIYANSVGRVVELYESMIRDGFSVCCIHSSMKKEDREKAFYEFRTGVFRVLISSNVTARGIDIQQVSTVINFDLPGCVHNYLHRIGRSGRWGRKGLAINFITRRDVSTVKRIETHYAFEMKELPTDFGF